MSTKLNAKAVDPQAVAIAEREISESKRLLRDKRARMAQDLRALTLAPAVMHFDPALTYKGTPVAEAIFELLEEIRNFGAGNEPSAGVLENLQLFGQNIVLQQWKFVLDAIVRLRQENLQVMLPLLSQRVAYFRALAKKLKCEESRSESRTLSKECEVRSAALGL